MKFFLQTVQFVAQYMRGEDVRPHSDITAPLRKLTKKNVVYEWTDKCEASFQELKMRLTDTTVLVPYVPGLETRLYVDHGPESVGFTVAQSHPEQGKAIWKAVQYKSRRLDQAENNYHKIERSH